MDSQAVSELEAIREDSLVICKEKGCEMFGIGIAQENAEDLVAKHTGPCPVSALTSRHPVMLSLYHLLSRDRDCIAGFLMGIFSPAGICIPSETGAEPAFSSHLMTEGVSDE